MENAILVLTNVPDQEAALNIAHRLIQDRLAACVNCLPAVQSVYRWQGKVEQANEITLLIKARQNDYASLEHVIRMMHPYDVPEIIAVPVIAGLPDYLAWIEQETGPAS